MDTNGIPTISIAPLTGSLADDPSKNAILGLSGPPQVGVGAIVNALFEEYDTAAFVCVNTKQRQIVAGPEALYGPVESGCVNMPGVKYSLLRPKAGQTGKSLEWEVGGTESGFHAATLAAINAALAPVTPKYTVGGLIQRIAASLPEGADAYLSANQTAGNIKVFTKPDGTVDDDAPHTETLGAGGGIEIQLSDPAAGAVIPAKKFEGGSF